MTGTPTFDPATLSVVFVDDDRMLVELFRMYVEEAHPTWKVRFFSDPLRALDYVKGYGRGIDVMVCDVGMPLVSGIELFEVIRERYPNIVRVTLSGRIDSQTIIGAGKHAECSLCKPIKGETLCATIIDLARQRHAGLI